MLDVQKVKVSIVTPSYKSEKFIAECIESVLSQTYDNWEMIIMDDCSPDNSNEIIKQYVQKDSRIQLIELKENSGPAVARNKAIELAQGRYIAFLDSDDLWLDEKLQKQLAFMEENDLALTYSSYKLIDEENNDLGVFITKEYISYSELLKTNSIGCLSAIYDTDKLGKVFMPLILQKQDYGLWLEILKKIKSTQGMLEPLAVYRIRKKSVSSNKLKAATYLWKVFRDVEKLNMFQSLYYFCFYIYNGLKKYK